MGVTYSRRALKGGWAKAYNNKTIGTDRDLYYIGEPLEERVRTYIGIAGSNWGSHHCIEPEYTWLWKMCNRISGFWPGSQDENPGLMTWPLSFKI